MTTFPQRRVFQVSSFFASHLGGLEVVADQLARRLAQAGVQLTWMAGGIAGEEPAASANLTIDRADYVDVLEKRTGLPAPIWSMPSLVRLWRHVGVCDVVHVHDFLYMPSLTAILFAWLRRRPLVMTQHIGETPFESRARRMLLAALNRSIGRWALRRAEQVAFVGLPVMRYYGQFVKFRRPPLLISNGVDHTLYRPREDAAVSNEDLLRVVFVGRFVETKGIGLLRRCVDMPGIQWHFVGSGPMLDEAWAARHATVHLHGRLEPLAVAEQMRAADILVLPSKSEGFPLVVQEALSCGTPVLVSKVVDEAFPRKDPRCVWSVDLEVEPELAARRLAERLAELRDDLVRVRSARPDAQRLAAQWSWDECVAAYLRIYSAVTARRESPAM
jgi:glycosyltransferase involved in cell wall biosynthesis